MRCDLNLMCQHTTESGEMLIVRKVVCYFYMISSIVCELMCDDYVTLDVSFRFL